ncbi:hypothetical protein JCM10212_004386 [Sporobolomyces blumeae]
MSPADPVSAIPRTSSEALSLVDPPVASTSTSPRSSRPPRPLTDAPRAASLSSDPPAETSDQARPASKRSRKARIPLTGTPAEILARNRTAAPAFHVDKTVRLAGKHWNDFYRNHSAVPFFKDRHWVDREWALGDKIGGDDGKGKGKAVLETGCGTGAFIYPLLEIYPQAKFVGFDFAAKAVELTKGHATYDPAKVHIFQHDLTEPPTAPSLWARFDDVPTEFGVPIHEFDIVSHIFVLSALAPRNHAKAVKTLIGLLAPGGTLVFRDYALHDEAQLRFHALPSASYATVPALLSEQTDPPPTRDGNEPSSSLSTGPIATNETNRPWYKRGDQTMTYFFTAEEVQSLVDDACRTLGCRVEGSVEVVERRMENRAQEWECTRRFVHGSWTRVA